MQINDSPPDLFAGIDNPSFDKRNFNPSQDDIKHICNFFSLGKFEHPKEKKNITVSHSNFIIFIATTKRQYALKFYSTDAARKIAIEYAVNRLLIDHHFPTPAMHAGHDGQPFLPSNNRLATCFDYVNGAPAWQHINQQNTIHQINSAMLSLKKTLSTTQGRIPFLKQESFVSTINALVQASRAISPYDQKKMIDASLQDAGQSYQQHQLLFTRQWLHNNATLTNFLIENETVYTLDLSHVRENYALSDLASLVISCLFFDLPRTTIKTVVKNYFTQHKIEPEHLLVLNTLIRVGLIDEYLKYTRREKSIDLSAYPSDLVSTYLSNLSARQRSITTFLERPQAVNLD